MAIFPRAEFLRRKILEKLQFFNILSYAEFHAESNKTTPEIFGIAERLQNNQKLRKIGHFWHILVLRPTKYPYDADIQAIKLVRDDRQSLGQWYESFKPLSEGLWFKSASKKTNV